jgi:hypothetical protein
MFVAGCPQAILIHRLRRDPKAHRSLSFFHQLFGGIGWCSRRPIARPVIVEHESKSAPAPVRAR